MSVKLHLLTALTRPWNLPIMASSISAAKPKQCDVEWHIRIDKECRHIGGQALKNAMLDQITDGWCWIFDDDTTAHPLILRRLVETLEQFPDTRALIVDQTRRDGRYLVAAPENVRVGFIDAGQAIMRRDFIGNERLPLNYEGDGHWLSSLLPGRAGVVYLNEPLSRHNALE